MKYFNFISIFITLFFPIIVLSDMETYAIDPVHSSVNFKIRHFFSKVTGNFQNFEGKIIVDPKNMEISQAEASIETKSINTNNEKRDNHLRNPDFFDVEQYPQITFKSKQWKKMGENEFDVTGDFSLHGVTKEVVLKVKSLGFGEGPQGSPLSGWEGSTIIHRTDFGITYGGPALGKEVEIDIQIEAGKV